MHSEKTVITQEDFQRHPVWHFDPDREIYSPVTDLDRQIGSLDELHFRATFTTVNGENLLGSIVGQGDLAIGIFRNGREYIANKSIKAMSVDFLAQLIKDSPDLHINDLGQLLPLKFQTQIGMDPFVEWSGVFDLD